ncbi:MAG TPA: ABC transporter ATP-binding protein [Casimicrobiaceae bacterium]|nr:ABC transporter ATP-binding protein [Casimicrobiaceae bacterium]
MNQIIDIAVHPLSIGERVALLKVRDLTLEFQTRSGVVHALEDVSFELYKGETLGLVGESGSGKSVLSYAILRILDAAGRITAGSIEFGGMDLLRARESDMQELRGRELAMIFQNPRVALNPIRAVGKQIEDVLKHHAPLRDQDLKSRAIALLQQVRIADPERRYHAYPFEMSGGQCQRVMIAIALACSPALLIADEPTTGLDVTTQAAIMDLVQDLGRARQMATLLITHDLGLAAQYCDRIVVMHAGHVVESAPKREILRMPRHPYTAKLIGSIPHGAGTLRELTAIPGNLPDLRRGNLPPCRYRDRCDRSLDLCDTRPLARLDDGNHMVACWNPQ